MVQTCTLNNLFKGTNLPTYKFLRKTKENTQKPRTNITKGLETVAEEVKKIGN